MAPRISFEVKTSKRKKRGDAPTTLVVHEDDLDRLVVVVNEDDAPDSPALPVTPKPAP